MSKKKKLKCFRSFIRSKHLSKEFEIYYNEWIKIYKKEK